MRDEVAGGGVEDEWLTACGDGGPMRCGSDVAEAAVLEGQVARLEGHVVQDGSRGLRRAMGEHRPVAVGLPALVERLEFWGGEAAEVVSKAIEAGLVEGLDVPEAERATRLEVGDELLGGW